MLPGNVGRKMVSRPGGGGIEKSTSFQSSTSQHKRLERKRTENNNSFVSMRTRCNFIEERTESLQQTDLYLSNQLENQTRTFREFQQFNERGIFLFTSLTSVKSAKIGYKIHGEFLSSI